jgi:hypothetical protein
MQTHSKDRQNDVLAWHWCVLREIHETREACDVIMRLLDPVVIGFDREVVWIAKGHVSTRDLLLSSVRVAGCIEVQFLALVKCDPALPADAAEIDPWGSFHPIARKCSWMMLSHSYRRTELDICW